MTTSIKRRKYFNGNAVVYEFKCKQNRHDLFKFMKQMKRKLKYAIHRQLLQHQGAIKWYCVTSVKFIKPSTTETKTKPKSVLIHFCSKTITSFFTDVQRGRGTERNKTINENLKLTFMKMNESMEKFTGSGSGWIFKKCKELQLKIVKFQPMAPAKY